MSLDDPRVEWLRDRVCACLHIDNSSYFEDLLGRGDGEDAQKINRFLNEITEEEGVSALLFFKCFREKEVEVEVPVDLEDSVKRANENDEAIEVSESPKPPSESAREKKEKSPGKKRKKRKSSLMSEASSVGGAQTPGSLVESKDERKLTRTEVKVVYRLELHVAVNSAPQRFSELNMLYFIRNTKEAITEPLDIKEANDMMPLMLQMGTLNGHPLFRLQLLLSHVHIPLLSVGQLKSSNGGYSLGGTKDMESKGVPVIRDEMLNSTYNFLSHVNGTLQQLEGEIKLHIPDMDLEPEAQVLRSMPEVVEKLDQCVMNWQTQITVVIEELQKSQRQGQGPMAEIYYWQERTATLSALCEQLKLPVVKKILEVMTIADPVTMQNLDMIVSELNRYHVEAVENVRFLRTLERHFKNLVMAVDFAVIIDTIPPMMNSLRLVWIISSHYNTDECMVPLMERIAWELSERVARVVNVHTLFK